MEEKTKIEKLHSVEHLVQISVNIKYILFL